MTFFSVEEREMKAKPKVCSEESFENSGRIFYQTAADEFRTGHCKVWCTRASAKSGWGLGGRK